nr:MAG TPA: hypothetical protein [Caudoviricetes sp.]
MKKSAIFYTIFLAVYPGTVLASRCCESAKIPCIGSTAVGEFIFRIFLGTPKYPLILSGVSHMIVGMRDVHTGYLNSL